MLPRRRDRATGGMTISASLNLPRRMPAVAVALAVLVSPLGLAGPARAAKAGLEIKVLSNRADLISGGDALVRPSPTTLTLICRQIPGRSLTSCERALEAVAQH